MRDNFSAWFGAQWMCARVRNIFILFSLVVIFFVIAFECLHGRMCLLNCWHQRAIYAVYSHFICLISALATNEFIACGNPKSDPNKKKIHRKINWSTNLIGQFPCCRSELIVGWFSILIENMVICGIIPKVPVVCAWKSQNHSFQYEARLLMLFLLLLFGCDCIKCRMLMYLESLIIIIEPCSKYFDCFRHTKSQQIHHLDIDIYYQQIIRMGCRCFFSRSLCSLKSIWPRGKEEEKRSASWINDKNTSKNTGRSDLLVVANWLRVYKEKLVAAAVLYANHSARSGLSARQWILLWNNDDFDISDKHGLLSPTNQPTRSNNRTIWC